MIWGIGSGRCGTKSLAKALHGEHEPQRKIKDLPAKWRMGGLDGSSLVDLTAYLCSLLDDNYLAVVDLRYSYMIPLIAAIDSEAEFIWVARKPFMCIGSFLNGNAWTEDWTDEDNFLSPYEGWPKYFDRIDKAAWYWNRVNQIILHDLSRLRNWSFIWSHNLVEHENSYPGEDVTKFTRQQGSRIMEATYRTYNMIHEVASEKGKARI